MSGRFFKPRNSQYALVWMTRRNLVLLLLWTVVMGAVFGGWVGYLLAGAR